MKGKRWLMGLSLVVCLTSAVWARLDSEEQGKVDALAQTLHLDSLQKAAVAKEREQSKAALLALEQQWQHLHDALRQEVRKQRPDEKATERISAELGKIRGAIIALRTHSLVFLKSILNPEQRVFLESGQPEQIPAAPKP